MRRLERLTLLRPNLGDFRSGDGLPPLALAVLAARTPKDVQVSFYDDRIEPIPENDQPDLAALTVETFTARRAYAIADQYRARGVPVVMGGHHPTFMPDEALEHADAVVAGDAEGSWETLLADFRHGALQRLYAGGNSRPLDDFAADRSIFKGKPYPPVELVQHGRGCKFACDFCSIRAFYPQGPRVRPSGSVAEEIMTLDRRRLIVFVDDNLFASKASLDGLLAAVSPLKVRWACQISSDAAQDDGLLDRMAEAGCLFVVIGFESLSEASLRQMGKAWNRAAGSPAEVAEKFRRRGMGVYGTFVFGYDGDSKESIRLSLQAALAAKLDLANFNPLTPTPGSPLYRRLLQEGRLLSPRWWLDPDYRYGDPIFAPRRMEPEEFAQQCFEARKAFYAWHRIAGRTLAAAAGGGWFRGGMVGMANAISRREIFRKQHRELGT